MKERGGKGMTERDIKGRGRKETEGQPRAKKSKHDLVVDYTGTR